MTPLAKWRLLQGTVQLLADARMRDPGRPVAEVAAILGLPEERVSQWLDQLSMVGPEDASPEEMFDAGMDGELLRIYTGLALPGPTRLTMREMVALLVAVDRVAGVADLEVVIARLRQKLLSAAGSAAAPEAVSASARVQVRAQGGASAELIGLLRDAVRERREVEIVHYSRRKDTLKRYTIQPHLVVQHRGSWYVVGRDDFRYRVDMIREATLTGVRFEPDPDFDPETLRTPVLFDGEADHEIILRTPRRLKTVKTASPAQVRAWVRRCLGALAIEGPADEREAMVAELRDLLSRYEAA